MKFCRVFLQKNQSSAPVSKINQTLTIALIAIALGSCRQTLFPKDKSITQFDSYNIRRFGPQITEQPDPFGVPEPALEERLLIKDN